MRASTALAGSSTGSTMSNIRSAASSGTEAAKATTIDSQLKRNALTYV